MPTDSLAEVIDRIEKGCQALRQGDDPDGVKWLQEACLLWMDSLDNGSAQELSPENLFALKLYLQNLLHSLNTQDIIRAEDILEYKILPQLKRSAEGGTPFGK